jgi:hypothetical protein
MSARLIGTTRPPKTCWRDAAANSDDYLFNGRPIIEICMYDGWPYWTPRPAICFVGPMHSAEWTFFDSYMVYPSSITPRTETAQKQPQPTEMNVNESATYGG